MRTRKSDTSFLSCLYIQRLQQGSNNNTGFILLQALQNQLSYGRVCQTEIIFCVKSDSIRGSGAVWGTEHPAWLPYACQGSSRTNVGTSSPRNTGAQGPFSPDYLMKGFNSTTPSWAKSLTVMPQQHTLCIPPGARILPSFSVPQTQRWKNACISPMSTFCSEPQPKATGEGPSPRSNQEGALVTSRLETEELFHQAAAG